MMLLFELAVKFKSLEVKMLDISDLVPVCVFEVAFNLSSIWLTTSSSFIETSVVSSISFSISFIGKFAVFPRPISPNSSA